jgi:hypothetical protein
MIDGYELCLQQYCTGCTEFDPEATFFTNSAGNLIWCIRCGNRGQCVRLIKHLKRKLEENNEDEVAN